MASYIEEKGAILHLEQINACPPITPKVMAGLASRLTSYWSGWSSSPAPKPIQNPGLIVLLPIVVLMIVCVMTAALVVRASDRPAYIYGVSLAMVETAPRR